MHIRAKHLSSAVGAAFLGLCLSSAFTACVAADPPRPVSKVDQSANGTRTDIHLGVGKSIIVDLPRDAAEVLVADPKVVSAIVRSARKLYLIAAAAGQTSIYSLDAQGVRISELQVSVGRDIAELEQIFSVAMPKSSIVAKTVENTIILVGEADSAADAQMAEDLAKGFLGQNASGVTVGRVVNSVTLRGRDQVMLKVTVAEVQRSVMKQLGVTNAIASGSWGAWTSWTRQVLTSADEVVIVATPDLANLRNVKNLLNALGPVRPNDGQPKLVMNMVGVPKRPEIAVKEFTSAVNIEATAEIRFEPKLFGTASNNGQMVAEVSGGAKLGSQFDQLGRIIADKPVLSKAKNGGLIESLKSSKLPFGFGKKA
jgi:Flp pilus assembly secretin CpaC